jgi:hypothetical protein
MGNGTRSRRPPARPSLRANAIAMALLSPTPERHTHDRVRRAKPREIVDENGNYSLPHIAETLLARLERQGDITLGEHVAGLRFQEVFRLAALDALHAIDPGRVVVSSSSGGDGVSVRSEQARRDVHRALNAMGGPGSASALATWYILGLEMSFMEFEKREGWDAARPLSREVSKGALIGALGVLEVHFGLKDRAAPKAKKTSAGRGSA